MRPSQPYRLPVKPSDLKPRTLLPVGQQAFGVRVPETAAGSTQNVQMGSPWPSQELRAHQTLTSAKVTEMSQEGDMNFRLAQLHPQTADRTQTMLLTWPQEA